MLKEYILTWKKKVDLHFIAYEMMEQDGQVSGLSNM